MIPFIDEIEKIKEQIINRYHPFKIILFGSCAAGRAKKNSDIDLCVICDYKDKKELLLDMLINIESNRDIDFILYRQNEYNEYKKDPSTFASIIDKKGVCIYG